MNRLSKEFSKIISDDMQRHRLQFKLVFIALALISFVMTIMNVITDKGLLTIATLAFSVLCFVNYLLTLRNSKKLFDVVGILFVIELTALFVFFIISDTDDSLNFLVSMAYTQMFNLLCEKADDKYNGRLPVHVRCLIDEMANIGQIPKLEKLMATIRSREISACLILQTQSQLKAIYKDNADTISGNCDSVLFLGGKEKTTLKDLTESLGKETIDISNTGESRGREKSYSLNNQELLCKG